MLADVSSPQTSGFVPSAAGLGRSVGVPSSGDGRLRPPDPASQSSVLGRRAEQSIRDPGPVETPRLLREQSGSQDVRPRPKQPENVRQGEARDDSHVTVEGKNDRGSASGPSVRSSVRSWVIGHRHGRTRTWETRDRHRVRTVCYLLSVSIDGRCGSSRLWSALHAHVHAHSTHAIPPCVQRLGIFGGASDLQSPEAFHRAFHRRV